MSITRKPINRGGIKAAGYDRASRVLEIEFSNGRVIRHSNVGEEIATRFLASSSPAGVQKSRRAAPRLSWPPRGGGGLAPQEQAGGSPLTRTRSRRSTRSHAEHGRMHA